jgi:hypothetical protein
MGVPSKVHSVMDRQASLTWYTYRNLRTRHDESLVREQTPYDKYQDRKKDKPDATEKLGVPET